MKTVPLVSAPLMLLHPCLALSAPEAPARSAFAAAQTPNIVLILADDLGVGDLQCLNPEGKIPTPCLDRLATQGITLTDAHSSSSLCSPSRYSILTGRYAWRTRLRGSVLMPYDPPLIAAGRLTLPALLKQYGYQTACIGKWHLGQDWPKNGDSVDFTKPIADGPTTRGFDYYFGTDVPNYPPYCFIENDRTVGLPTAWKDKGDYSGSMSGRAGPMLPGWKTEEILPTLAGRAIRYIGERAVQRKPFFLYMALTSPHEPISPSKEWQGRSGINPVADFIMQTDDVVGQVLNSLEKNGLAANTLVIFTADNGHSPYTGLDVLLAHGHHPSGPYRGYKTDIWDGGHREPFIARWPGKIKPGTTCSDTVGLTDLMATTADILGSKLPDTAGEDSVSILPDLLGTATGPIHEAIVHQGGGGALSIRQGPWKLELCPGSNGPGNKFGFVIKDNLTDAEARAKGLPPVQLYDLGADIGETRNVQAEHPEIVARLTKLLEKYIAEGRSTPGAEQKNDVPVPIELRVAENHE